jgi:hypothetical protein
MEKTYVTSAGLSGPERMGLIGFSGLVCICWTLCAVSAVFSTPGVFSFYLRLSLDATLAFSFLLLIRLYLGHEMRRIEYAITDTALLKKSPYKLQTLYYDQILRLRFVTIPLLGRFLSVRFAHGTVRIPFRVFNCTDLVDRIAEMTAKQGAGDPGNELAVKRFKKALYLWEESDCRLRRLAPVFPAVVLCTMCAGVLSSFFIWDLPLYAVFVWSLFGLLMNSLWVVATEPLLHFSLARRYGTAHDKKEPDCGLGFYGRTAVLFLLVYLASGILFHGYYY